MTIPPPPYEHRFSIDGESYLLVGWSRAADRRIRADYAMGIASAPAVLDILDGGDLYAECVARECLREAPDFFWESVPATPGVNGQPQRVLSFEQVPLALWERFRKEVDAFVGHFRPTPTTITPLATVAGQAEPDAVATPETLPPRLRGRAE